MTEGSTPAWAHEIIRAMGVVSLWRASAKDMSTTAAAPSLIPEAFPAVTVPVPSWRKHGLSLVSASNVVPCLGNWSSVMSVVAERLQKKHQKWRKTVHKIFISYLFSTKGT
jgi:hypothetical protein